MLEKVNVNLIAVSLLELTKTHFRKLTNICNYCNNRYFTSS